MLSENLTKEEFNIIGVETFIAYARSIIKYVDLVDYTIPSNNGYEIPKMLLDNIGNIIPVYEYDSQIHSTTIKFIIPEFNNWVVFKLEYLLHPHLLTGSWDVYPHTRINYSNRRAIINRFNKFIKLEKLKLLAKPYDNIIKNDLENLFM